MPRHLRVLIAAALTVATFAGASAANASTPADRPTALAHAAAEARSNASSALGGIALPAATTTRLRASAAPGLGVQSLHETLRVNVQHKKYDVRLVSVGSKADATRMELFLGTTPVQVSVRRLVRITVIRHGYRHPLLETTTTFLRSVVMMSDLVGNPLVGKRAHFATRSDFVAAFGRGLGLTSTQVLHEYGATLRLAQMALDLAATLLQAAEYAAEHPTATAFGTVTPVQTSRGSGGYAGTVTLTGTPAAFTVTSTNTTDDTSLSESLSGQTLTISYTAGGRTVTQTL